MRKLILLSIFIFAVTSASAQSATVKRVRTLYTQAVKEMDDIKKKKNSEPGQYATFTKDNMAPFWTTEKKTVEIYAPMVPNDDKHPYHVCLIRETIKEVTGMNFTYYNEYLFDTETEQLLFCFQKHDAVWCEEDVVNESRYYFDKAGKCDTFTFKMKDKKTNKELNPQVELEPNSDEIKVDAERLKIAFHNL